MERRDLKTIADVESVLWDAYSMLSLAERAAFDLQQEPVCEENGDLLCGIELVTKAARDILFAVNEALANLPNDMTLNTPAPLAAVGGGS